MSASVRLTVNVSEENWAGVESLMAREGVTETQAVHRLLTYGNRIYEAMAIEGKRVYFELGDSRERFRLLHVTDPSGPEPVPERKI